MIVKIIAACVLFFLFYSCVSSCVKSHSRGYSAESDSKPISEKISAEAQCECVGKSSIWHGHVRRYIGTGKVSCDLSKGCDNEGAFGFRWGEKPRNKECNVPCVVEYSISHQMFDTLRLCYGEGNYGLESIELSGPIIMPTLDVRQMNPSERNEFLDAYVHDMAMPIVDELRKFVKYNTGDDLDITRLADVLIGGARSHDKKRKYGVGIRVSLPNSTDKDKVFIVNSYKNL